jgi:hypothetical protein
MKKQKYIIPFILFSVYLCTNSLVYSLTPNELEFGKGFQLKQANPSVFEFYQPLIAALSGAVLTSGCFIFFLKRMVSQYDSRHDKHDKQILDLYMESHDTEKEINDKIYAQGEIVQKEIRLELTAVSQTILTTLDSLRSTIQVLVADIATLQAEHNSCDYKAGDINVMKKQIENMSTTCKRLEKHIQKHIDDTI